MEATLFTLPSSRPPPSSPATSNALSLKSQFRNPFLTTTNRHPKLHLQTPTVPKIHAAISRTKKEETVDKVKQELEDCHLIAGISYKGLTVQQFRELRTQLPETTKLLVAKNTLVYKAIEGTKWEALKPCIKGMNAWLFVHSEEIPAALKPYRNFQKEKKLEENDFTGAVFEGKFYGPTDFKTLENLPTRAEIYARILGSIKGPASAVVGTIQAPARDLILVLQAYCKKLEEEGGGQYGIIVDDLFYEELAFLMRASVFEAIEEEDRVIEKEEGLPPALLGSCNERAKQLHNSPSGRLLTALICEYLDWAQLNHTLKPKDSWKSELKEFSSKNGYDLNRNGDSGPLLLDVLEGFLKYENLSQGRGSNRRSTTPDAESLSSIEARNMRRPSPSSVAGGLPPLGRALPASQSSDRGSGSSTSGYRKEEYNWRYDNEEPSEYVVRASAALENLQLDRKARSLTSSWRHAGDGISDENS